MNTLEKIKYLDYLTPNTDISDSNTNSWYVITMRMPMTNLLTSVINSKYLKLDTAQKNLKWPINIQIIYAKSLKEIFQIWQQSYLRDIANNEFEAAINVSKLSKIKTKF